MSGSCHPELAPRSSAAGKGGGGDRASAPTRRNDPSPPVGAHLMWQNPLRAGTGIVAHGKCRGYRSGQFAVLEGLVGTCGSRNPGKIFLFIVMT